VLPEGLAGADELRPVLSLHSQVVFLKDVPAGAAIGYAGTWTAERATRIATLPVGYNDGLSWRLGNSGEVLVRGRRARIVGRVSMDYTTVDVGHIPGVQVGDHATLIGAQAASASASRTSRARRARSPTRSPARWASASSASTAAATTIPFTALEEQPEALAAQERRPALERRR
jgi:alanine racemase